MSTFNPTLSVIGIPDPHIHVYEVYDEFRGKGSRRRKVHVIFANLSYSLNHCPLCGMNALRPNGHKLTHIHVKGATEVPTIIDLNKQRWWCDNCGHSVMGTTPLVETNHSIAKGIEQRVIKLAQDRLPRKTIALLLGISSTTVQRFLNANVKYHAAKHLPVNLCFDEFRSTSNMMSFICIDGDTHRLVSLLGDRLNKTIKDFFINQYSLKERRADGNDGHECRLSTLYP